MRRPLSLVCLLFVIAVFACVNFAPPDKAEFGQAEGKTVCLAGKVYHKEVRPSTFGGDNTIIYLNHIAVSGESKSLFENEEKLQGVMCYMKEAQEVPLGSLVVVRGKLQSFMEATNPGEFDSRQYYQILKLDFRLKNVEIERISENYNKLQELLYRIKEKCSVLLEEYYDSIDAGIMKTILLGDKNSLAEEVEEQYKRNGIIHIMAISGVNTLNLVSLSKLQMPNLRAFPQVLLRKFTLFYQQILSGFCPLVVLPLFRGCFSKLTKWQKEYLFAKV